MMAASTEVSLISIVIPVFNEETGIDYLADRLSRLRGVWPGRQLEFILVDDGSSDQTQRELERVFAGDPSCMILRHARNRGVGAAFRTGFSRANGEIVCTIDADCTYGPENLRHLVDVLDHSSADIAVASPYHPDGGVDGVPGWRLALSRGCSALYRICSPVRLYTYTSVFRAYRKSVVSSVQFESDGFVSTAEILIRAAHKGFAIAEVPMILYSRKIGHSKMRVLATMRQHLYLMIRSVTHRIAGRRMDSLVSIVPPNSLHD
jgi:dolichol-phosphate mannosyltransferase